ncbi:MAG TPA: Clp protease N-terminal domain-containing protein [Candidatus Dormibacteraeota bacterium]|nr:Clp protease N-terminal domain-containing protein [Candidatus Dormibacteraeota bacterium]
MSSTMYPFERFTEDAKKSLTLAQEEAERSNHSYIGTEHLLLGLVRIQSGAAHAAFKELGITEAPVRALIDAAVGRHERVLVNDIIPTSRVKTVIEMSFDEARRMGHHEVDPGHILIGLVMEGNGIAAHVLQDLGATAERVVSATERAFGVDESGRGRDRPRGQAPIPVPSPGTDRDINNLMALLYRPRIARLLSAKGLNVETLKEQLLSQPDTIQRLADSLNATAVELTAAIATQDFERAAKLRDKVNDLVAKLETAESEWLDSLI